MSASGNPQRRRIPEGTPALQQMNRRLMRTRWHRAEARESTDAATMTGMRNRWQCHAHHRAGAT